MPHDGFYAFEVASRVVSQVNDEPFEIGIFGDLFLDAFPLIKCFGHESRMGKIAARLKESKRFEVANIRDPFVEGIRILLVTDIHTSKGKSLSKVLEIKGRGGHVIAAGDD